MFVSENWSEILDQSNFRELNNNYATDEDSQYSYTNRYSDDDVTNFLTHFINGVPNINDDEQNFVKFTDTTDNEMMLASRFLEKISCEVGSDECPYNAECVPLGHNMRNGICKCMLGMEENAQGSCVPIHRSFSKDSVDSIKKGDSLIESKSDILLPDKSAPRQKLTVSILSKQVRILILPKLLYTTIYLKIDHVA